MYKKRVLPGVIGGRHRTERVFGTSSLLKRSARGEGRPGSWPEVGNLKLNLSFSNLLSIIGIFSFCSFCFLVELRDGWLDGRLQQYLETRDFEVLCILIPSTTKYSY